MNTESNTTKKFDNLMIDIETFGTDLCSVVLSIAATPFNETEIGEKIYFHHLPIESQLKMGRTISQETWNWWSEQTLNPVAKPTNGTDLDAYMILLSNFISDLEDGQDELRIWSNPPQFDIKILEDMYKQVGRPIPWSHRQICDVRTVKKLLGKDRYAEFMNKEAHNPVSDNEFQIKIVQKFINMTK